MKVKIKLSLLFIISLILIVIVVYQLIANWHSVNQAMAKNRHAEQVEFRVNRLESDFHYMRANLSPDALYNWQLSLDKLNSALADAPAMSNHQQPLLDSIKSQTMGIATLFDGLKNLPTTNENGAIKKHLEEKILAAIQTIREEAWALAQSTRESIVDLVEQQLYNTVPLLLGGVLIVAIFSADLIHWLNASLKGLNNRLGLLHQGNLGSVYTPKTDDEFRQIYEKINDISRKLVETTISRDTLQNIVDERTKSLENLANTDPLTQVATRRVLFKRGVEEFKRARRHNHALSLLMIDCDYFKKINDTFGHCIGDSVLIHLCRLCENEIRAVDIFARFGGEEFVIVLPETNLDGAQHIAKRIQQGICSNPMLSQGQLIKLTVSIGVANLSNHCKNFEHLIDQADKALYLAKERGRNNIQISSQEELG